MNFPPHRPGGLARDVIFNLCNGADEHLFCLRNRHNRYDGAIFVIVKVSTIVLF